MDAVKSSSRASIDIVAQLAESDAENQESGLLAEGWSSSLQEMICAATISETFCQTLLTNPDVAISRGFNGQHFSVPPQERMLLRSIRANTLSELIYRLRGESVKSAAKQGN